MTRKSQMIVYWYEFLGMFIFVYLQACTSEAIGIHLQITLILLIAIPMIDPISGAHFNPAVSLSNCLCKYHKGTGADLWTYFKAQLLGAFFALATGYILNDNFLPGLALPSGSINPFRLMLSETISTAILVFFNHLICNSKTSIVQNSGQKFFFVVLLVFYARKTAYVSSFAINPAITIGTVLLDILTCRYLYLQICGWYLIGDLFGAIIGTVLFDQYVPILMRCKDKKQVQFQVQMELLSSMNTIKPQNSKKQYSRKYINLT